MSQGFLAAAKAAIRLRDLEVKIVEVKSGASDEEEEEEEEEDRASLDKLVRKEGKKKRKSNGGGQASNKKAKMEGAKNGNVQKVENNLKLVEEEEDKDKDKDRASLDKSVRKEGKTKRKSNRGGQASNKMAKMEGAKNGNVQKKENNLKLVVEEEDKDKDRASREKPVHTNTRTRYGGRTPATEKERGGIKR